MEILKSIGLVIMLFISTIFTVFGEEQQTMTYDMAFSLADYSVRIQDDLLFNSTYKIRYYERHAPIGNKMLMSGVSLSTNLIDINVSAIFC